MEKSRKAKPHFTPSQEEGVVSNLLSVGRKGGRKSPEEENWAAAKKGRGWAEAMGENAPPPLPRWAGKILCCFASTPAFSSSNNVLVVLHGHWNEMGEGEGKEAYSVLRGTEALILAGDGRTRPPRDDGIC